MPWPGRDGLRERFVQKIMLPARGSIFNLRGYGAHISDTHRTLQCHDSCQRAVLPVIIQFGPDW